MRIVFILAAKEIRDGLRNRWVAAAIVLLATLALALAFLGSAPIGPVRTSALGITVASLASLTVYLLPLIALMLAYDALVGEAERGTLLLLLAYPVARWQVVLGKFLGHTAILVLAILVGYGGAGIVIALVGGGGAGDWGAYLGMMGGAVLLGAAFIGLGYLSSAVVRERATAAGLAIGLWLGFVVLYDLALLGALVADTGQAIGPGLFSALMLLNPTDLYRILTLTGSESASQAAGMAGVAAAGLGPLVLLGAMAAWVVAPLAATVLVFRRREL